MNVRTSKEDKIAMEHRYPDIKKGVRVGIIVGIIAVILFNIFPIYSEPEQISIGKKILDCFKIFVIFFFIAGLLASFRPKMKK